MMVNRQSRIPVPFQELERFLARAQRRLRLPEDALTVCFVTDSEMARWNRAYRGKSGPTDVMSFPTDAPQARRNGTKRAKRQRNGVFAAAAPDGGFEKYLGDIAIAPAVAKRDARRFGRTFADEMRILILHGILHLMGYDHEADNGQMDRREKRLRRELGLA
jgi:probable rRNA maturation factor